jgi:hypothetical protein
LNESTGRAVVVAAIEANKANTEREIRIVKRKEMNRDVARCTPLYRIFTCAQAKNRSGTQK